MKKTIIFFIQLLFVLTTLFAEKWFAEAEAINAASEYIEEYIKDNYRAKINLYIDDFECHRKKQGEHIRDRFEEALSECRWADLVPRKKVQMDKIKTELDFQHNSGMVNRKSIIPIGEFLEANAIIFGKFEKVNEVYNLRVIVLDVKTGKYIAKSYDVFYRKVGLGLGAEANKNTRENFIAPGISLSFDYNAFKNVSLGLKMFASYAVSAKNDNLLILEPLAFFRVYMVYHSGEPGTGVFLEGLGGVSISNNINSVRETYPNGGLGLGYRLPLKWFYIEPEIRFGYPYIYGASVNLGFRF